MTDVTQVTEVAKGIGDLGMMTITAAFFLVLSALMMVAPVSYTHLTLPTILLV